MAPAYIRLFEHINEKIDAWGNPTFIFRITQTKDANGTDLTAPRTHIVALTVNDDNNTGKVVSSLSSYNTWLQESTDELEYHGMYHIDSQGRIRVEPGSYEITRVPVSRYEFVTSASTAAYDTTAGDQTVTTDDTEHDNRKKVIITGLAAGNTIDVHYYDQVAYYDKFTHVDTKINKFYKLNESTQANETIKGLIVRYDGKAGTSTNPINITTDTNFKAKLIYVDGSERELSDKSNITIDANSNSDITVTNGITINVTNPASHSNNVYTLKAKYDNNLNP